MNATHYIGLDVHKKTISYCMKTAAGQIVKEGTSLHIRPMHSLKSTPW
jgi:hypothetical protein